MKARHDIKNFLSKRIVALFFVLLVMSSFFIPLAPLNERINQSLVKTKNFVANKNLDEDISADDNILCKNDQIKCKFRNPSFYKRMDTYLDFVYLKDEPLNTSGLEERIAEADSFFRNLLPFFPSLTTDYSYIDSSREEGEVALDTSCILGWTYNDTFLFNRIKNEMKSYGWTNPNTTQAFRKLIDETWCISLLGQNNVNSEIIKQQVDLKKQEFYVFINGSDYLDRKIVGGIHLLLMFDRLQKYRYDISQYSNFIEFTKSYVVSSTKNGNVYYPIEVYNNVLYTLSKIHYGDKEFLQSLAEKLLLMQNQDGSWTVDPEGRYKILETLRCSIALNLFKVNYL